MLKLLGIEDYDTAKNIDNLKPTMDDVFKLAKKRFGTNNLNKIGGLIRLGMVRELNSIEARKKAQLHAIRR